MKALILALGLSVGGAGTASADSLDQSAVSGFIDEMVQRHGFVRADLESLFQRVNLLPVVLGAISQPAEAKPWYKYRPRFVTPERVQKGIDFWIENRPILERAEKEYRVPAEVIVAIIGVETYYGRNSGDHRVADALATLAFNYPRRAAFFRSELEEFLLFTREQKIDPLSLNGSYAGAMGIPQFIPSSYRSYAVDFDGDGLMDIWNNTGDAVGSVANYLKVQGWEIGKPVAVRATVTGSDHTGFLDTGQEPRSELSKLEQAGVVPQSRIDGNPPAILVALETEAGEEYWVTLKNFYVIRRYNRSPLYAMAVYQLGEAIREGYKTRDAGTLHPLAGP